MSDDLSHKRCIPCEGGAVKMTREEAERMHAQVPEWTLSSDATVLSRSFPFKDFQKALDFVNKVGEVAQAEWHHPDIKLGWGKAEITFTTHSIRGLSENDFIMAAKVDALLV